METLCALMLYKLAYLLSLPLWMALAGKFCSMRRWDSATQRWTDLIKMFKNQESNNKSEGSIV